MQLECEKFGKKHYDAYKSWFDFENMSDNLEGIDEEWLQHILSDRAGNEYAFSNKQSLVGVVGIVLPDENNIEHYITNIATHPNYQRQGIGLSMLQMLIELHTPNAKIWKALVHQDNHTAQCFFEKAGWSKESIDVDNMFPYCLIVDN